MPSFISLPDCLLLSLILSDTKNVKAASVSDQENMFMEWLISSKTPNLFHIHVAKVTGIPQINL